ncbi:MAG TPA: hypothetical protein VGF16_13570 [Bryobacteraceae bacterium]
MQHELNLKNKAEFRCPCALCVEARKRPAAAMPLDSLRLTRNTPPLRLVPRLRNAFSAGA